VTFEVLTALTTKNTILWDVPPSSIVKAYQRFGRTYVFITRHISRWYAPRKYDFTVPSVGVPAENM
jgi:hypothetical protein